MRDWLLKKTEQTHKGLFATLGKLSAQASYHILRLCGLPKMNYWSPPSVLADAAQSFDTLVLDIINGQFRKEERRALLGSILVALPKPNGKIRPIAMGKPSPN